MTFCQHFSQNSSESCFPEGNLTHQIQLCDISIHTSCGLSGVVITTMESGNIICFKYLLIQIFGCKIKLQSLSGHYVRTWWRHQMKTFFALLAICAGNSPVTGEFPAQRPVTRCFDVFFDLRLNQRLLKQSWGWWFETLSRPLLRHCNDLQYTQNKLCTRFTLCRALIALLCSDPEKKRCSNVMGHILLWTCLILTLYELLSCPVLEIVNINIGLCISAGWVKGSLSI